MWRVRMMRVMRVMPMTWIVRMVVVPRIVSVPIEFAAASACAHVVRGAGGTFGVGVGGSDWGGSFELSPT